MKIIQNVERSWNRDDIGLPSVSITEVVLPKDASVHQHRILSNTTKEGRAMLWACGSFSVAPYYTAIQQQNDVVFFRCLNEFIAKMPADRDALYLYRFYSHAKQMLHDSDTAQIAGADIGTMLLRFHSIINLPGRLLVHLTQLGDDIIPTFSAPNNWTIGDNTPGGMRLDYEALTRLVVLCKLLCPIWGEMVTPLEQTLTIPQQTPDLLRGQRLSVGQRPRVVEALAALAIIEPLLALEDTAMYGVYERLRLYLTPIADRVLLVAALEHDIVMRAILGHLLVHYAPVVDIYAKDANAMFTNAQYLADTVKTLFF